MTQVLHPLCMQQQLFKCKLASVKVPLATIRVKLTVFTLWSVLPYHSPHFVQPHLNWVCAATALWSDPVRRGCDQS